MNRQELNKSIMKVAKELARKWETQPMSVAYLVDGSMVSFINKKGITRIYLKKCVNGVVYSSKVSVLNQFIVQDTTEHFENMIHYCYFNTDFPSCGEVLGE